MDSVLGIKKINLKSENINILNKYIEFALNYISDMNYISNPIYILYDNNYCFVYCEDKNDNHYFYWNTKEVITYTKTKKIIRKNLVIEF